jgi:2-dehydropantoate 2-reductase
MKENLKVAVIGLGGVGGYFGYKLASKYKTSTNVNIAFIARGETYSRVAATGLLLISPEHTPEPVIPHTVRKEISGLDDTDIVLICVKAYDLREVCYN